MRADADTGPAERSAVIAALKKSRFDLSDDELARLVELSELTAQRLRLSPLHVAAQ
jgi:hypothetical protein